MGQEPVYALNQLPIYGTILSSPIVKIHGSRNQGVEKGAIPLTGTPLVTQYGKQLPPAP